MVTGEENPYASEISIIHPTNTASTDLYNKSFRRSSFKVTTAERISLDHCVVDCLLTKKIKEVAE